MSYFTEVEGYETYAGKEFDFHFYYTGNSGGGLPDLGGKFCDKNGNPVSSTSLLGRKGIFRFPVEDLSGQSFVLLEDDSVMYEIIPRSKNTKNPRLQVQKKKKESTPSEELGLEDQKKKKTPSLGVAAFLMLPDPCGIYRPDDKSATIWSAQNFWIQSMWMDADIEEDNKVIFTPKDCIICGGIDNDDKKEKPGKYYAVNFSKRISDIIKFAESDKLDGELKESLKLFADIYTGKKKFIYDEAKIAIESAMNYLSGKYPERCSGGIDPLTFICELMWPYQLITYGAPGTGKSFGTDSELGDSEAKVFRTTFHPDSDYSTFVGTYKPTMKSVDRIVQIGQDLKMPNFASGVPKELKTEEKITYKFRPQAFMNAYAKAWRELSGKEDKPPKPVVLIIEEINRGNCAQIFGDLFQLLDRDDKSGYSTYPITADIDLAKWLAEAEQFGPTGLDGIVKPYCIKQEDWVQILKGEMLALPPNLYIWATMNTSDQSLFPIDSAFKRRWDWKYVPIREGKLKNGQPMNWKIKIKKDYTYDWWKFLKCVNARIFKTTESEDKKLGYFFVKPDGKSKPELDYNDCISADRFVSKVIFYLWNDVFKDYGIETIFKVADADKKPEDAAKGVEFQAFFNEEDDHANVDTLHAFFEQLGLKPDEEKKAADNPQVQEGDVKPEV